MSEALYKMAGGRMAVDIGDKQYMARKLRPADIDYIKAIIIADRKKERAMIREEMPDGPEKVAMIKELLGDITFADIGPFASTVDGMAVILWLSVRRDDPNAFKDVKEIKETIDMSVLIEMMEHFAPMIFGERSAKKAEKAQEASP